MPRIEPIQRDVAQAKAGLILDMVQAQWGMVPNMIRTMAQSPAATEGFLSLQRALAGGLLGGPLREKIALTVAETNGCRYGIAAHMAIGRSIGIGDDALRDARRGTSTDHREDRILRFVKKIVQDRGAATDADLTRLRDIGVSNEEIVEIIAHVGLNLFADYFTQVADPTIDFPMTAEIVSS